MDRMIGLKEYTVHSEDTVDKPDQRGDDRFSNTEIFGRRIDRTLEIAASTPPF